MTRRIWKIDVPIDDQAHVYELPDLSTPVHVACQHADVLPGLPTGLVQVWFEIYDDEPTRKRAFIVRGTGQPFEYGHYIGTGLDAGGALVWHVFAVQLP